MPIRRKSTDETEKTDTFSAVDSLCSCSSSAKCRVSGGVETRSVDDQRNNPFRRRVPFQYGLSLLFGLTTLVAVGFAYPLFVLGTLALLTGALIALLVFVVVFYYPVAWIASRLHRRFNPRRE